MNSLPTEPDRTVRSSDSEILEYIDSAIPDDTNQPTDASKIPEASAQDALDKLWDILESPSKPENFAIGDRRVPLDVLERLSLKLTITYHKLPTAFHLKDVKCENKENPGTGAYADVYREKWGERTVALKRLRAGLSLNPEDMEKLKTEFCREAFVWRRLEHKHILPFLGVSYDAFESSPCMVLPWLEFGDIRHYISTLRVEGALSQENFVPRVNNMLYQVSLGLAHLHGQGIVHGDLHGGNILIDSDGGVRLTDFGFGLIANANARNYGSRHGGAAIGYSAPELIDPAEFDLEHARPTHASDMYAFASTCYELHSDQPPFAILKYTEFQVSTAVVRGKRPPRPSTSYGDTMSDSMWSITERCWAQKPDERPPAQDVADYINIVLSGGELPPPKVVEAPSVPAANGAGSKVRTEGTAVKEKDLRVPTIDPPESHGSGCCPCLIM